MYSLLILSLVGFLFFFFFFFNDTATTEIYTLSLHDALPIFSMRATMSAPAKLSRYSSMIRFFKTRIIEERSEEHTSELQSLAYLVCRLLLEKKKKFNDNNLHLQCTLYIHYSLLLCYMNVSHE